MPYTRGYVFVEYEDPVDADLPYEESKLWHMMDCYAHTICIHINIPKMDQANLANLDRLRIYDEASDEGKYELSSEEEAEQNADTVDTEKRVKEAPFYPFRRPNDLRDQDFDEGLGDSEAGDSSVSQPQHSDPSEDSSSFTDSERTLVGDELSPRNNSPAGGEPSPGSDVGRPECDSLLSGGCSSSPEEDRVRTVGGERYFKAWPYTDYETGEKMLRVYVDKRTTLAELKKELEPHIGIKADNFKIFRVYSNCQEFECTRLSDNLMSYGEDSRLTIKLGRALRKGEYKVRIYRLSINDPEPCKFLVEWVLVRGMTVLKAKKEILPHIKETCNLDIPLNRCRLRKKSWKNPSSIFFDHQRFEKDIPINANWEMFLEVLPDAEPITSHKHYIAFTRRWHPATMKLDPFAEIVLEDASVATLSQKLHEISDIPLEFVEFAKGQGTFPCEVSLLNMHREDNLEWMSVAAFQTTHKSFGSNLYITDDGLVIFYRDKREELKKLSDEEMREISNKENAKSTRNLKTYSSPRKEKALKIYTVDSPPSKQTPVVPDLD
ncbi:hypothetical protein JTE90_020300 [Oedothorax gibbosus]|uniref:Ubiquitin carboxyl-terminal hydrolase 47 C-terminal domain-containing protein n=1 Tax=Oedothorax gibbosus TaxID=931172 RepID=A0AAV6VM84_9ARAC|nr:hypothetical protein JTE90_020300 [Oedothorax gibbosus]